MKKDQTKRSHYVTQLYQEYFRSPGAKTFWVYDKTGGEPRPQQPKDTAIIRHLYKFQTGLEEDFSKQEGSVKPILDRWQTPDAVPEPQEITTIAPFLAYLHTRGPRGIKAVQALMSRVNLKETHGWVQDPEAVQRLWEERVQGCDVATLMATDIYRESRDKKLQEIAQKCLEEGGKPIEMEELLTEARKAEEQVKSVVEKLLPALLPVPLYQGLLQSATHELSVITKNPPDSVALHQALLHTEKNIVPDLLNRNWCLCTAPEHSFFVTSDTPIFVFDPESDQPYFFGGFQKRSAEVAFPLSPRIGLLLSHTRTQKRCMASESLVEKINRMTVFNAERFVMSPFNTEHLQWLVVQACRDTARLRNNLQKEQPRKAETNRMREMLVKGFLANKVKISGSK